MNPDPAYSCPSAPDQFNGLTGTCQHTHQAKRSTLQTLVCPCGQGLQCDEVPRIKLPAAKPTHTPGPWVVAQNSGPLFIAALTDRSGRIATISDNSNDQRIACANARLIASAPEMHSELLESAHTFKTLAGMMDALLTWADELPLPVRQKLTHATNLIELRAEPIRSILAKAEGSAK